MTFQAPSGQICSQRQTTYYCKDYLEIKKSPGVLGEMVNMDKHHVAMPRLYDLGDATAQPSMHNLVCTTLKPRGSQSSHATVHANTFLRYVNKSNIYKLPAIDWLLFATPRSPAGWASTTICNRTLTIFGGFWSYLRLLAHCVAFCKLNGFNSSWGSVRLDNWVTLGPFTKFIF